MDLQDQKKQKFLCKTCGLWLYPIPGNYFNESFDPVLDDVSKFQDNAHRKTCLEHDFYRCQYRNDFPTR
jgi:hypothetical protein